MKPSTLVFFALAVFALPISSWSQRATGPSSTFSKDVMPILQARCQMCHRPGEIGPMPLMTYEDARPWARAIRENVIKRTMPPWHADPNYGHFANDRRLSDAEIQTIVRWVDAGAPEGNPGDLPTPRVFPDGWN